MSGTTSIQTCPVCGHEELNVFEEFKPFPMCDVTCEQCGLYSTTNINMKT